MLRPVLGLTIYLVIRAGIMRTVRAHVLAGLWLCALVASQASARAEDAVSSSVAVPAVAVPECASDARRLGLSRIVEIDTADGPHFGGGRGAEVNFLKDHEVILTFDDGPLRAYTKPILKVLADHCTRATFFLVGRMASADPEMVREIARAGHTIGSHTQSHLNLQATGLLKGRQEVDRGIASITRALGRPPAPFFRFPFLGGNRHVDTYTKSRGMATFWVDVDAKDYQTRNPAIVHARIMAQLRDQRKGIILMHDIQPSTAHAIAGLLDDLHAKGFKVVHMVPKLRDGAVVSEAPISPPEPKVASTAAGRPAASTSAAASGAPTTTGSTSQRTTARRNSADAKPGAGAPEQEALPWLLPKTTADAPVNSPAPASTPATKPKRQARSGDDGGESWFAKIFNN